MGSGRDNKSSGRGWLKIAVPALGLMLAAALGLAPATVQAQGIKPDRPEQERVFEALNQWMSQNAAAFSLDLPKMQDPFLPMKEVRVIDPEPDDSHCPPPFCHPIIKQFKLVGITMPSDGSGALASFEDGTGDSYLLRKGDRIGRDNGHIVEITVSTVTVEELPRGASKPRISVLTLQPPNPAELVRPGYELPGQSKESGGQPGDHKAEECPGCPPPLVRLNLSAFKLVGITLAAGRGPLASFEDEFGHSYLLRPGDLIGNNQGCIVKITGSAVTVREPRLGPEKPARLVEIKLEAPAGQAGLADQSEDLKTAEKPPVKVAHRVNEFEDIKPDTPEQKQSFEALNKLMRQNAAAYNIDLSAMQDPFTPPRNGWWIRYH